MGASISRGVLPTLLLLVASCLGDGRDGPQEGVGTAPFHDLRTQERTFPGDGRDEPVPSGLTEVRLGWFGPADPTHPEGGEMWSAAQLAVEEANARGGYGGLPFRLVATWSDNPWGTGVRGVTRLVYEEEVWALVGAPDSGSVHLVEQVTAKARLPFVNPIATDKSANLAGVPWIFSSAPGDHVIAPVLARALLDRAAGGSMALVTGLDHDSRLGAQELATAMEALGAAPTFHFALAPDSATFTTPIEAIRTGEVAAVGILAGAADTGRFLVALRGAGLALPVVGGPSCGRRAFLRTAGEAAEGIVFPMLWDPALGAEAAASFEHRFRARTGHAPDYTAAHAFDAVNLLIDAVQRVGLNRARLRDALREMSPWRGVTGQVVWDPAGHNTRAAPLATVRDGVAVVR